VSAGTEPTHPRADEPIAIVGLLGGQWFGRDAEAALRGAAVLLGHADQFALLDAGIPGERVELWGDLAAVVDTAVAHRAGGRRPCILAAGDPGFHGMVRFAAGRLGDDGIAVHPAPSSVAMAFARLGAGWDDAVVASVRTQPPGEVVATVDAHPKVAVLVSPRLPPEGLGAALLAAGCGPREVAVCSHLAEPDERVTRTDLAGLAGGTFDPLSVVVLRVAEGGRHRPACGESGTVTS
jgi:precorrin-6B C5,15-methyltransferase / cobalt-precorrin-6B C5,C15-methyltransferase